MPSRRHDTTDAFRDRSTAVFRDRLRRPGGVQTAIRDGARLLVAIVVTGALVGTGLVGGAGATAAQSITIDYDGEAVTVANGTSQVVSGTADFREGTELSVRVRSTGDTQPRFLQTANAVVTANGTWAVALDFSRQSAGDSFEVTVVSEDGNASTSANGDVVACGDECAETPPQDTPTPRPEQTATPTPTPGGDATVTLEDAVVLTEQGTVATVEVVFGEADVATLTVGNESDLNYELVATVTDEDDDGRATVFFDTAQAGRDGRTLTASGEDGVTVESETSLSTTLDPADYPVDVYAGEGTSGRPASVGTIVVQTAGDSTGGSDTGESGSGDTTGSGSADTSGTSATGSAVGASEDPSGPVGAVTNNLWSVLLSGVFVVAGGGLALLLLRD